MRHEECTGFNKCYDCIMREAVFFDEEQQELLETEKKLQENNDKSSK